MESSVFFVSDIHLKVNSDLNYKIFLNFIKKLNFRNCSHLFLLGDIFDFWIGGSHFFQKKYDDLIFEIKRLAHEGVEIHYFEGNHDLHLHPYWGQKLGVQVHPGPYQINVQGLKLYLEHGDEMDPEDKGYIFLRWLLRSFIVKKILLSLSGRLLSYLGDIASGQSRNYTSTIKSQEEEQAKNKILSHVKKLNAEGVEFDVHISGHLHIKEDKKIDIANKSIQIYNLGSWLKSQQVLELKNGKFSFRNL